MKRRNRCCVLKLRTHPRCQLSQQARCHMARERVEALGAVSCHPFVGGLAHRAEDCGMGKSTCRPPEAQEQSEQWIRSKGSNFL